MYKEVLEQGHCQNTVVGDSGKDLFMERVFSGKKVEYDRIVEIEQNGSVAPLPLEPSLEIADHSPDGFN